MPSVFDRIRDAGTILAVNARASFRAQTAYVAEGFLNALSTFAMLGVTLVFLQVIFARVDTIATYTRGETLLLLLFLEAGRQLILTWSYPSNTSLISSIRSGALDLLLLRPMPHLLYIHTREIEYVTFLRDGAPGFITLAVLIPWSELPLSAPDVLVGLTIFLLGQLAFDALLAVFAYRTFWDPSSFGGFWDFATVLIMSEPIPAEGYPRWLATACTTVVPGLLVATVPVSVMLGKLPALPTLALSVAVTVTLCWVRILVWRTALRTYTSASS